MSLFDYYLPEPPLKCPACNADLNDWRGTDGPSALFVWKQGQQHPADQLGDSASRRDGPAREGALLPVAFRMHASCCSSRYFVEAIGRAPNGTWNSTELITAATAQRDKEERMEDFKARLRWLKGSRR